MSVGADISSPCTASEPISPSSASSVGSVVVGVDEAVAPDRCLYTAMLSVSTLRCLLLTGCVVVVVVPMALAYHEMRLVGKCYLQLHFSPESP